MIQVLPIQRVIGIIALLYIAVFLAVFTLVGSDGFGESMRIALLISGLLDLVLAAMLYFGWEWIWARCPKLNTWVFPNLNGTWDMTIQWFGRNNHGTVHAKATIKQDFISMSMEVASDGSDSETMMVRPKIDPESGRPLLYYFYRVVPRKIDSSASEIYQGAAILRFDASPTKLLRGNYFTSKQTTGHFELTRETQR
jgi:hypothetical protein